MVLTDEDINNTSAISLKLKEPPFQLVVKMHVEVNRLARKLCVAGRKDGKRVPHVDPSIFFS